MYNPEIHHRRSIRLREYDYAANGAYFVTICVQGRECLFGDISDGAMTLNEAGFMVAEWWAKLPDKFNGVSWDEFEIMPNHFHGIICNVGADPCVCPPLTAGEGAHIEGAHMGAPLHGMVQWFKTMHQRIHS